MQGRATRQDDARERGTGTHRLVVPCASSAPRLVLPALALAVVALLDVIVAAQAWPVPVVGALDEPAHLLTAWLFLVALPARYTPLAWPWALVGAVVIDLDHVPLFLWGGPVAEPSGRPTPHSLATVLLLLALAWLTPRRRAVLGALATGVLLHLVRDVAGGPGVPLLWPLSSASVRVPYLAYLVVLTAVAAAATWHAARFRRQLSQPGG